MKNQWTTWLLGGALAASLQWNLGSFAESRSSSPSGASSAGQSSMGCSDERMQRCTIDLDALGLTDDQTSSLDVLCRQKCERADGLEARAEQRLLELREQMMSSDTDAEELHLLVAEISDLRRRALQASVDSVLGVREILDRAQLNELISTCYAVESCGSAIGCKAAE